MNRANENLAQGNVTNARAHVQNIMELELESEFDYILSWGTIHHSPDAEEGIRIPCWALKPGVAIRRGIYGFYRNWESAGFGRRSSARSVPSSPATSSHNGLPPFVTSQAAIATSGTITPHPQSTSPTRCGWWMSLFTSGRRTYRCATS